MALNFAVLACKELESVYIVRVSTFAHRREHEKCNRIGQKLANHAEKHQPERLDGSALLHQELQYLQMELRTGLPGWPFPGHIYETWPFFKLVGVKKFIWRFDFFTMQVSSVEKYLTCHFFGNIFAIYF